MLGRKAVGRPRFDFQGVTEKPRAFLKTAVAFEDLAVAAYGGQAARLNAGSAITAAVSIYSVEARHAAWMRYLFGLNPAAKAFDQPKIEGSGNAGGSLDELHRGPAQDTRQEVPELHRMTDASVGRRRRRTAAALAVAGAVAIVVAAALWPSESSPQPGESGAGGAGNLPAPEESAAQGADARAPAR